jgi:hypothetical protein
VRAEKAISIWNDFFSWEAGAVEVEAEVPYSADSDRPNSNYLEYLFQHHEFPANPSNIRAIPRTVVSLARSHLNFYRDGI